MTFGVFVRRAVESATEEFAGVGDSVLPLEGGAGVHFVGLDVVMAEDALVSIELGIGELVGDELPAASLG